MNIFIQVIFPNNITYLYRTFKEEQNDINAFISFMIFKPWFKNLSICIKIISFDKSQSD